MTRSNAFLFALLWLLANSADTLALRFAPLQPLNNRIEHARLGCQLALGSVGRRAFLPGLLAVGLLSPPAALAVPPSMLVPAELRYTDEAPPYALNVNRRTSRRLAAQVEKGARNKRNAERKGLSLADAASSLCFGGSVYFSLGSRNSPLVPALGRALWEPDDDWLKDREEGMYSDAPLALLGAYLSLCLLAGAAVDRAVLRLAAAGDDAVTLQLAVLSLLSAGFLELSRIDSGEKMVDRVEAEREEGWRLDFEEFARERIVKKAEGSCHKSDVVRSFRRYYGKYRTEQVVGGPTDMDVERLLVKWNAGEGGSGKLPTSGGFVKGITVKADVLI